MDVEVAGEGEECVHITGEARGGDGGGEYSLAEAFRFEEEAEEEEEEEAESDSLESRRCGEGRAAEEAVEVEAEIVEG